jgi:hypothetical protein
VKITEVEPELLTEREASARYNVSIPWLRRARSLRSGPPFIRIGRLIRYRPQDVERYIATRVVDTLRVS